jgi:hypothetical protein
MLEVSQWQPAPVPTFNTPAEKIEGSRQIGRLLARLVNEAKDVNPQVTSSIPLPAESLNTPTNPMPFWISVAGIPKRASVTRTLPYLPGDSALTNYKVGPNPSGLYHLLRRKGLR